MDTGNVDFDNVTFADLLLMQSDLKDSVVRSSVYVMHRTVWVAILTVQENSQTVVAFQNNLQPVVAMGERDQGITPVGFLHGKAVYVSDKMPDIASSAVSTKFIYLGSHKVGIAFGDRQQMTLSTSKEATVGSTNMFETNQQAIKVTERVALQIIQPLAFVTLSTSAT